MRRIKLLLYRLFGLKGYLKIVSSTYIKLIRRGKLRNQYPEIHFLKQIVKDGDTCIDIGANVGYYSYFLSRYAGEKGHVYAVEPVALFGSIWKRNVKKTGIENLTLLPFALGSEEKNIEMGMPKVEHEIHHGMTKVLDASHGQCEKVFTAQMRVPDKLFANLEKLDFVKIDVEGYESIVLDNMKQTLQKFHPLIQGEMGGTDNRRHCVEVLTEMGYQYFKLCNNNLCPISKDEALSIPEDIYFKIK